jgi:G3E family GTPase
LLPADLPTLVVGGYLGAGKTTLVNHLLRHAGGRRIAVLVNDFGDVDIDAELIVGQDGEVLSLAGGCVCCSFGSDLVGTLMALPQRSPPPEVVLIELSGVALPAAVVRSARLAPGIDVVGTLVVLDAADVARQLADRYVGDTVRQQLADADLLLLNKTDLIDPADVAALREALQALAPRAAWLPGAVADLPVELVLGWRDERGEVDATAAGPAGVGPMGPASPKKAAFAARPISPLAAPRLAHRADAVFATRHALLPAGTDLAALGRALVQPPLGVLRAKALAVDATGQGQLLQVVGPRWRVTPSGVTGPGRLVVIGLRGTVDGPAFGVQGLEFGADAEL